MLRWNALKKDSGFTLIEMLAVAVIIGVVSAIAVPNLLGLLNNARVTDGTADIEGAIKEAKRQAIRFSQTCVIEFATTTIDGNTRHIVIPDSTVGGNNNRCLLEQRVLPEGVVIQNSPGIITISSKGSIDYTNSGAIASPPSNRTFTISHPNAGTSKCVVVEGLFGDIQTGIIQGGNCNTNL